MCGVTESLVRASPAPVRASSAPVRLRASSAPHSVRASIGPELKSRRARPEYLTASHILSCPEPSFIPKVVSESYFPSHTGKPTVSHILEQVGRTSTHMGDVACNTADSAYTAIAHKTLTNLV